MSWGKRAEMIVHEQDPYNAEPPPGLLADAFITPTDVFYSRNHGPIPVLDPKTWSSGRAPTVRTPRRDLRETDRLDETGHIPARRR